METFAAHPKIPVLSATKLDAVIPELDFDMRIRSLAVLFSHRDIHDMRDAARTESI